MTVFGIFGGIGTGKTLAMVWLAMRDAVNSNKTILSNIGMDLPNCRMIEAQMMDGLPSGLRNSTMCIDEIHNFMDSRDASNKKVKKRTHFILQSRHSGEGTLDIIYTTQFIHQVDKRLRGNTDVKIYPSIIKWEPIEKIINGIKNITSAPSIIMLVSEFFIGHRTEQVTELIDVSKIRDLYDTHEIVQLDT